MVHFDRKIAKNRPKIIEIKLSFALTVLWRDLILLEKLCA